ncbi:GNAT family N-acetyltransferase [Intrasporangium calvum]|uniref:GCN5-related N-acetyltransferase n=1 Tax=Intrasporangium calvum (strain ATCC 23552 / DSM 43043 / JCM 3097 / NBRC 12989 / NCIMB 10167 / NRRL B-3866 / 7 KIP) TaxID=710696 RepID=E6SG37_INTC7|nr:GNAT family N-acetyltransferase [Intrasporangium calvum]ADU49991.1 GCN5-related N-acetyltransferase [Intrasporangium calvum DSM 43043]AXG15507.1 N-acetyltransferase [Intrasporangium calvum]
MKTLESRRVRLRQWSREDASFVFVMCSRWEVQRYIGVNPRVLHEREEAVDLIGRWQARQDDLHRVWAVEHHDGRLLGTLLLVAISGSGTPPLQPTGETEIGWYFHPDAWGQGFAHEAASLGLGYAFAAGLKKVLAVTHPDNTPSQALCRRLGMRHEGRSDRYYNMTCELFSTDKPGTA